VLKLLILLKGEELGYSSVVECFPTVSKAPENKYKIKNQDYHIMSGSLSSLEKLKDQPTLGPIPVHQQLLP
jgi:hypothetical protein